MRLYVTVICALLLLAGCANTEFSPSGDTRAPPYSGEVQVLQRLPAEGSYRMLGILIVRGVNLTSDEKMFAQLKQRAAAQGADAVVPQGPIRAQINSDGGEDRKLAAYAILRK